MIFANWKLNIEAMTSTIEGSLDIRWINFEDPRATPRYDLLFSRYKDFKNGAQQPYHLVETPALERYLTRLGFTAEDAKVWVSKTHEKAGVSIPNVHLTAEHLADFGLSI